MTNLLDILKETELRVRFTEAFRTTGAREVLRPEVLQRRLLLCLYGLGTNAGLKRMRSGGGEDGYDDLQYIRRRRITKEQLRAAISPVCNAIFRVRNPALWGEGTTAGLEEIRRLGSEFDYRVARALRRAGRDDLLARGEELGLRLLAKACSSSEVAAMIEGVLRHDTEMDVEKQYVDTHGQSEVGFAFCYLLGFALLPRLKNLKKQRLYRPEKGEPAKYANLEPILTRPINWEIIEQQYDELIKLATALRLGTADGSENTRSPRAGSSPSSLRGTGGADLAASALSLQGALRPPSAPCRAPLPERPVPLCLHRRRPPAIPPGEHRLCPEFEHRAWLEHALHAPRQRAQLRHGVPSNKRHFHPPSA